MPQRASRVLEASATALNEGDSAMGRVVRGRGVPEKAVDQGLEGPLASAANEVCN